MDYSKITLGELLSSDNETIKRNAISVLKQLQNNACTKEFNEKEICYCPKCFNERQNKQSLKQSLS